MKGMWKTCQGMRGSHFHQYTIEVQRMIYACIFLYN